ncbi:hypothetical protein MASR2M79_13120 [Aminivibrio sp.]
MPREGARPRPRRPLFIGQKKSDPSAGPQTPGEKEEGPPAVTAPPRHKTPSPVSLVNIPGEGRKEGSAEIPGISIAGA